MAMGAYFRDMKPFPNSTLTLLDAWIYANGDQNKSENRKDKWCNRKFGAHPARIGIKCPEACSECTEKTTPNCAMDM